MAGAEHGDDHFGRLAPARPRRHHRKVDERDVTIMMEALFDIRAGVHTILDALEEENGEEETEDDA